MNISLPATARGTQNLQHIVGSALQVINYSTAGTAALFATGNISMLTFGTIATIAFILNRASSELSFQTSQRLFREYASKENNNNERLYTGKYSARV